MLTKNSGCFPSPRRSNKFPHEIPKQIEDSKSDIDCVCSECGVARHEHIAEFEKVQFNLRHSNDGRRYAARLLDI